MRIRKKAGTYIHDHALGVHMGWGERVGGGNRMQRANLGGGGERCKQTPIPIAIQNH